jgi:response regulator RpfG family c-di-GMP phosphodiesterase
MSSSILIIDDDVNLLSAMKRQLRGKFLIITAQGGEEAVALLSETKDLPAVILCDMRMGGMNGVETLRRAKDLSPESVRMMLTGNADMQTAIDAINNGNIFRFLTKPCAPEVLEAGLEAAMEQHRLIVAERELLETTLVGSIKVMMDVLALAYPQGYSRATRIRQWVRKLNTSANMPHRWQLDIAAMLAPLGMLSVPDEVLMKVHLHMPLTDTEQWLVDRAPEMARDIIANVPRLNGVAQIVYLQNKGFDGSGPPENGPVGGDIPIDARLLKILNDLGETCKNMAPGIADFAVLEANPERYDLTLLRKVKATLIVPEETTKAAKRRLTTALLLPGMDLADDVVNREGRLILAGLTPLSEQHIDRLRNLAKLRLIEDTIVVFADSSTELKM